MLLLNIVDSVIAKASQQEEIVSPYLIQRKTGAVAEEGA